MTLQNADVHVWSGQEAEDASGAALLAQEKAGRRRKRGQIIASRLLVLVAILGAWEISSRTFVDPFAASMPSLIFDRFLEWLTDGFLLGNLAVTLMESVVGFAIGAVIGISLGLALSFNDAASKVCAPYINALYALPKVTLGPLFVIWFGIAIKMKIVMAAVFVVFLIFYNTWSGARDVDQGLVDSLRLMNANKREIARKVVLPSALVWVFNGLRVSFPLALMGATIGEIIASKRGIGFIVTDSAAQFDTTGVFTAIFTLMFVAVAVDRIIVLTQAHALKWDEASSAL
ncbi:MAG: ABC transporter permease subunit [Streptosporangiales bacterium]|nr:ABC transporter permease subunit [Streptosporangiales bacterium]